MCGKRTRFIAFIILGSTFACSPGAPSAQRSLHETPADVAVRACPVKLPAQWSRTFDRHRSRRTAGSTIPFNVAPDGHRFFAAHFGKAWTGIVAVTPSTGNVKRIRRFDRPSDQVDGGEFDGRWLAWTDDHSRTELSDWALRVWDSRTGAVRTIATVARVRGNPIIGPFVLPVVEHGMLAWTQSTADGHNELHLYDLSRARDRVVTRRNPGAPTFAWPWLIWTESDRPGLPGSIRILSIPRNRRLALPEALKAVTPGFLGGAPGRLVWTDTEPSAGEHAISGFGQAFDYRTVRYWRVGMVKPIVLARMPEGEYAQFPTIADHLVVWGGSLAQYIADLRSGSYAQATPQYGSAWARGQAVLVAFNPSSTQKSAHPTLRITVVGSKDLAPLPRCK